MSIPVFTTKLLGITVFGYFTHRVRPLDINSAMITIHDPDPDAICMSGTPWEPLISAEFSGFFADLNGNKILQGGTATGTGDCVLIPIVEGRQGVFDFASSWSPTTPRSRSRA